VLRCLVLSRGQRYSALHASGQLHSILAYVEVFWRLGYDLLLYIGIYWRFEAQQYGSADVVVGVGEPRMSIWSLDIYVDDTYLCR